MNKLNVIAVDLAKTVFQVCVYSKEDKVLSNKEMNPKKFKLSLAKQARSLVAFESCGRAHHWARVAQAMGHEVIIIPAHLVKPFRQGQKTDGNDALAIAWAARHQDIKKVGILSLDQQSLQSELRIQQHLSDQKTATSNLLRGLLAEFGIEIARGDAALCKAIPWVLEDAENGLPIAVRESLHRCWEVWRYQTAELKAQEKLLNQRVKANEACQRLVALEGVGPKNALGLYIELGDAKHFKNGRNAAACLGVTPKQHSSGGIVKIGHIGRYCGNQRLRATLITGAHSVIQQLDKRDPRTGKERWLKALIERRGKGRAAVALANKTVRTAWAILKNDTPYAASLSLAA